MAGMEESEEAGTAQGPATPEPPRPPEQPAAPIQATATDQPTESPGASTAAGPGQPPAPAATAASGTPSAPVPAARQRHRHTFWVALLLILATILTPVAIVAAYIRAEVTDSGRYIATIKPLSTDPAIQNYVATTATNQLFANVDVNSYVSQALPPQGQVLVGPITSGMKSFVNSATLKVVQSSQFQTVWIQANTAAHQALNKLLTGQGKGVTISSDGSVTLNLAVVAEQVKAQLEQTGIGLFSKIPADKVSGSVTIFKSKGLYRARRVVQAIDRLGFILPIVVIVFFALAILLSLDRRRGFMWASGGLLLGTAIVAIGLALARAAYLDAVVGSMPRDAAASFWDIMLRFLRTSNRNVALVALIALVVALIAGSARAEVGIRAGIGRAVAWLGRRADATGWGVFSRSGWLSDHKGIFRALTGLVLFVILFAWTYPTPAVIFWLCVAGLVILAFIEFYGRSAAPAQRQVPPRAGGMATPAAGQTR